MKNFHQNLLIVLALSLCGLCACQWYGQTVQRIRMENLNHVLAEKSTAIHGYTNSIETLNHQIQQMDGTITSLKASAATNEENRLAQMREISRLQLVTEVMTNEISQYTNAVTTLETRLKQAYADMTRQNDAITNLVAQRDDLVKKYNEIVNDRNTVVAKYNDLVSQLQKQQSGSK